MAGQSLFIPKLEFVETGERHAACLQAARLAAVTAPSSALAVTC